MTKTTLNTTDPKSSDFAGPCPRCGGGVPNSARRGEYPGALSRLDNETYICSDCGVTEAFNAGWLIPFSISLYGDEAKYIRAELKEHTGDLMSGEIECSCGWVSGHFPTEEDARKAFHSHLITAGSANFAHADGRHDTGSRSDLQAWSSLGCRNCKEALDG